MIAIDSNVVVYYLLKSAPHHLEVRSWFNKQTNPCVTTGTNFAEALRVLSHPQIFKNPFTLPNAYKSLRKLVEDYDISVLDESSHWWMELDEVFSTIPELKTNDIFDARIALCLRYNGVKEIFTYDEGFLRFPFLKIVRD